MFDPLLRDSNFSIPLKCCEIRDFQAFFLIQLSDPLKPDEARIDVFGSYWIRWIQLSFVGCERESDLRGAEHEPIHAGGAS